jgi:hypothetical protein
MLYALTKVILIIFIIYSLMKYLTKKVANCSKLCKTRLNINIFGTLQMNKSFSSISHNLNKPGKDVNENNQSENNNKNELTNTNEINPDVTTIRLSDNKRIEIDNSVLKKLEKVNKIIPIESLDSKAINDILKYKIFEDSVAPTVDKLTTEVPEIAKHKEFVNWVKDVIDQDKQEEVLQKQGLVILKHKTDILHKYGIDIHNYKKYQDRDYEVDIEELLTKDLYAKQRVIDSFIEANKDKINELIGYYQSKIGKATRLNKYSYLIYQNNYTDKMYFIKKGLLSNLAATAGLSVALYLFNPMLLLLLIPDYASILYTSTLLNNLVDQVILLEDKKTVVIRKFNFLGFRRELPANTIDILNIEYRKKIKNPFLSLENGLFFITRLFRRLLNGGNRKYNNFKGFHNLIINSRNFYIPADNETQHEDTDEKLILAVMNKDIKFLANFDYSEFEDRLTQLNKSLEEYNRELAAKSHNSYFSEEDRLRMKYSKFLPNRDFKDIKYQSTLKRKDDTDEYIDNGYR